MKEVLTSNAPSPGGHYSQAIIHDNIVYISGQLPTELKSDNKMLGTVEEQTQRALVNLAAILEAAGTCKENVLKTTIYIADIDLWGRVNKSYADFFGKHKPARSIVPTKKLHFGFLIEIEAIAAIVKEN